MLLKYFIVLVAFPFCVWAQESQFTDEAKALAVDLKQALVGKLSAELARGDTLSALQFCQLNAKSIAGGAAGEARMKKYAFGRSSHKIRNELNLPADWMKTYLEEWKDKNKSQIKQDFVVHKLPDGKLAYLEPLYIQPMCLQCHGESVTKKVSEAILKLYPADAATGFKVNEFRGFLWVKQK